MCKVKSSFSAGKDTPFLRPFPINPVTKVLQTRRHPENRQHALKGHIRNDGLAAWCESVHSPVRTCQQPGVDRPARSGVSNHRKRHAIFQ